MNIDDLKDAWGKDEPHEMRLPLATAELSKTTSAIARLRKNMKSEFWGILVSYFILIYFTSMIFVYGDANTSLMRNVIGIPLFTILVLSCFYYGRFYVFYRSINRYDLSMRSSIRKFTYELELNTEIYKTYNFCVTPLAVLVAILIYGGKGTVVGLQHLITSNFGSSPGILLSAFAVIIISFAATYFGINMHVRLQYGRYLAELKQVLNDLEED